MKGIFVLFVIAAAAWAEPSIVFTKAFPGSHPPYVEIIVERDGKAVYKEAADDDQPIRFLLKKPEVDEIYQLAEKLDHFKQPLESGLKVANMGMKTFRWVDGAAKTEVKYNFSQDLNARALQEWFEKMTETEQHYIALERTVKFDKLGANKAILQMQAAMERNRLVALEQFLPLLDRVIKNDSYLNMARERAAGIAEAIRNPKGKTE
ncbi:MAG: hypothetical protein IT168_19380 [Bryobacterales bacterium]|nr:hypothetical protein [Bryobacterales bacterium]